MLCALATICVAFIGGVAGFAIGRITKETALTDAADKGLITIDGEDYELSRVHYERTNPKG